MFNHAGVPTSVFVLAEILLRSPQKLFIFIIKKTYLLGQRIQKENDLILKKTSLVPTLVWQFCTYAKAFLIVS